MSLGDGLLDAVWRRKRAGRDEGPCLGHAAQKPQISGTRNTATSPKSTSSGSPSLQ